VERVFREAMRVGMANAIRRQDENLAQHQRSMREHLSALLASPFGDEKGIHHLQLHMSWELRDLLPVL
jgi:hypothetical protein